MSITIVTDFIVLWQGWSIMSKFTAVFAIIAVVAVAAAFMVISIDPPSPPSDDSVVLTTNVSGSLKEYTYDRGEIIEAPEAPVLDDGFIFKGWTTDLQNIDVLFDFSKPLNEDVVIYAVIIAIPGPNPDEVKHIVEFKFNVDFVQMCFVEVDHGSVATFPHVDEEVNDYNFKGWYTDQTYTERFNPLVPIRSDTVVFGLYEKEIINVYSVKFVCEQGLIDGERSKVVEVEHGEYLNVDDYIPEQDGWIFKGWYDHGELIVGNVQVDGDRTLVAEWAADYARYEPYYVDSREFLEMKSDETGLYLVEKLYSIKDVVLYTYTLPKQIDANMVTKEETIKKGEIEGIETTVSESVQKTTGQSFSMTAEYSKEISNGISAEFKILGASKSSSSKFSISSTVSNYCETTCGVTKGYAENLTKEISTEWNLTFDQSHVDKYFAYLNVGTIDVIAIYCYESGSGSGLSRCETVYAYQIHGENDRFVILDDPDDLEKEVSEFNGEAVLVPGKGSSESPFIISEPEQLLALGIYGSNNAANFVIIDDLDMSGLGWSPVDFRGKLDGRGHTISNLNITNSSKVDGMKLSTKNYDADYTHKNHTKTGLFGKMVGAEVSDLSMDGISLSVSGKSGAVSLIGTLSGYAYNSIIDNITITNTNVIHVKSDASGVFLGGLIGMLGDRCTITDIIVDDSVNLTATATFTNMGGLFGGIHMSHNDGKTIVDYAITEASVKSTKPGASKNANVGIVFGALRGNVEKASKGVEMYHIGAFGTTHSTSKEGKYSGILCGNNYYRDYKVLKIDNLVYVNGHQWERKNATTSWTVQEYRLSEGKDVMKTSNLMEINDDQKYSSSIYTKAKWNISPNDITDLRIGPSGFYLK